MDNVHSAILLYFIWTSFRVQTILNFARMKTRLWEIGVCSLYRLFNGATLRKYLSPQKRRRK